jgi:hypothetical protein
MFVNRGLIFVVLLCLSQSAFAQSLEVLNPDVHQDTINQTICTPGYTKKVRPAVSYTNGIKRKLLREQGIDQDKIGEFELDHIVPLVLGGHPRNIKNLVLQSWNGVDNAKIKDKLEVKLSKMVCKKQISLIEAQSCIWNNWKFCASKY